MELSPEEDIYEVVGERLQQIAGSAIVIINAYERGSNLFTVKSVKGLGGHLDRILGLLGRNPVGMTAELNDENARQGLKTGRLVKGPGGLYELSFKAIPKGICYALEKLIGLGDIFAVGFTQRGALYGSALVITFRGKEKIDVMNKREVIETLINQAAVAMQRKRFEDALRDSESRYRLLAENASDIIWTLELETSRFTYVSPSVLRMRGFTPKEVLEHRIEDVVGPESLKTVIRTLAEELARDGEAGVDPKRSRTMEIQQRNKDGSHTWVEATMSFIRDDQGRPREILGVTRDISEKKRAEEETRHLRNYLSNIIDSMPSILVGVDKDGRVTQWNQAAEKATGVTAKEARGRPLETMLPILGREMPKVRKAIRDRDVQSESKAPCQVAGEMRFKDVTVYPLITNGVEGAVIRVDDVTERVRMEEMMIQSEKMLSVGGLAAGMAHEINNPLGVILQASQNLLRRVSHDLPTNARVAEECGTTLDAVRQYLDRREIPVFLADIRKSAERAAGIVSNMLSFSRKAETRGSSTDMAALLDTTVVLAESDYDLKKRYDFRQIEIVREFETDLPPVVCQASQIQQVFLNILRNGAEAMNEHSAKSRAHGEKTEPSRFILRVMRDGDRVRVEIEDNGPGMDEATRRRIFEPFFTTKPPGLGMGLGLSVSYFIITDQHGGTLTVESAPGAGARFVVLLPTGRSNHGMGQKENQGG